MGLGQIRQIIQLWTYLETFNFDNKKDPLIVANLAHRSEIYEGAVFISLKLKQPAGIQAGCFYRSDLKGAD